MNPEFLNDLINSGNLEAVLHQTEQEISNLPAGAPVGEIEARLNEVQERINNYIETINACNTPDACNSSDAGISADTAEEDAKEAEQLERARAVVDNLWESEETSRQAYLAQSSKKN